MGGGFWGITWFSGEVERGGVSRCYYYVAKIGNMETSLSMKCWWCVHLRGGGYIRISGSLRGD